MTNEPTFFPIVEHKSTKVLYAYKGQNIFENLVTGGSGEVSDEQAAKAFKLNVPITEMCNEYPLTLDLIKKLNLKAV
jgi:hypothetical protein